MIASGNINGSLLLNCKVILSSRTQRSSPLTGLCFRQATLRLYIAIPPPPLLTLTVCRPCHAHIPRTSQCIKRQWEQLDREKPGENTATDLRPSDKQTNPNIPLVIQIKSQPASLANSSAEVVIESFESVPNKRETHLRALLLLSGRQTTSSTVPGLGGLEVRGIVRLVDLIGREVGGIDVGRKARLKRRADPPQAVELDAPEKGVVLELVRAAAADAIFRVADQTVGVGK